jgi:hypothetical protein
LLTVGVGPGANQRISENTQREELRRAGVGNFIRRDYFFHDGEQVELNPDGTYVSTQEYTPQDPDMNLNGDVFDKIPEGIADKLPDALVGPT